MAKKTANYTIISSKHELSHDLTILLSSNTHIGENVHEKTDKHGKIISITVPTSGLKLALGEDEDDEISDYITNAHVRITDLLPLRTFGLYVSGVRQADSLRGSEYVERVKNKKKTGVITRSFDSSTSLQKLEMLAHILPATLFLSIIGATLYMGARLVPPAVRMMEGHARENEEINTPQGLDEAIRRHSGLPSTQPASKQGLSGHR